jgi:hypothetical protein
VDFLGNPVGIINLFTSGVDEFLTDFFGGNIQSGSKVLDLMWGASSHHRSHLRKSSRMVLRTQSPS